MLPYISRARHAVRILKINFMPELSAGCDHGHSNLTGILSSIPGGPEPPLTFGYQKVRVIFSKKVKQPYGRLERQLERKRRGGEVVDDVLFRTLEADVTFIR